MVVRTEPAFGSSVAVAGLTLEALRARFDLSDGGGYLPNGRVEGATDADWLAFLRALRAAGWPVSSGLRGNRPLPETVLGRGLPLGWLSRHRLYRGSSAVHPR